ncbi:MAG: flagellar motor protein PomA [Desulfobacteraceae bacterium 4484_190.2]|nr:MAG: flagellar motor protein PomA [Desulfobacteraceae bacterium 4484_190.2]
MDIATIIGLIGGTILVLSAIFLGGSAVIFFNIPGLLIVVGGTLATSFIKFSMAEVINSIKVAMKAFTFKMEPPEAIIQKMLLYSKIAKKEGMIALEKEKPKDAFSAKALQYLSDGFDEENIEHMLKKDIRLTIQRHTTGQSVFKGMGASAPAFGMIGTLIGLVQMLANMSNPASIGPAMAVALLTTLYGALIANLVCLPIADKLFFRTQQEQEKNNIVMEGTLGICRGSTGMVLEEALKIYLSPKVRGRIEPKKKAGGGEK